MDRELRYPFEKLEQVDTSVPTGGIAIITAGRNDIVALEGSQKFVAKAREVMKGQAGADKIKLTIRHGGHGFDGDTKLEEPWLVYALEFPVEPWLR